MQLDRPGKALVLWIFVDEDRVQSESRCGDNGIGKRNPKLRLYSGRGEDFRLLHLPENGRGQLFDQDKAPVGFFFAARLLCDVINFEKNGPGNKRPVFLAEEYLLNLISPVLSCHKGQKGGRIQDEAVTAHAPSLCGDISSTLGPSAHLWQFL